MRINSKLMGFIIVTIIIGGIFGANALELWQTQRGGEQLRTAVATEPEEIRGNFRFQDISDQFEIPLEVVLRAFCFENHPMGSHIRSGDIEDIYHEVVGIDEDIGNGSVQFFVALYTGNTPQLIEETFLPDKAVEILLDKGISQEWEDYIKEHSVTIGDLSDVDIDTFVEKEDFAIKGVTTFRDILNQGVSQEEIEEVLGGIMPNPLMTIRDYCEDRGIGFGGMRVQLEQLLKEEV
ncbi:hypothetical protein GGQ84_002979 [Desulfitispora alkaliphila]|uniref:hypothetical protein n=1 Tax=Desulfitispora alkaliphila TaxID=622674 RepID=UPI003D21A029